MNELPLDKDELRELLASHCNGTIDQDRMDRLEAILRESEEARGIYFDYLDLQASLVCLASLQIPGVHVSLAEKESHSLVDSNSIQKKDEKTVITLTSAIGRYGTQFNRFLNQPAILSSLVAVLAIMSVLLALALISPTQDVPPNSGLTEESRLAPAQVIANIVSLQNDHWVNKKSRYFEYDNLAVGEFLRLQSGLVKIQFLSGASVLIEGPATVKVVSGHKCRLLQGRIVAHVPKQAKGFTVVAPEVTVVDLGTEFALHSSNKGMSEVHVFEGKVEAIPTYRDGSSGKKLVLLRDEAARFYGKPSKATSLLVANRKKFIRSFIKKPIPLLPVSEGLALHYSADQPILDFNHRVDRWVNQANEEQGTKGFNRTRRPLYVKNAWARYGAFRFNADKESTNRDFFEVENSPGINLQKEGMTVFVVARCLGKNKDQFLFAKGQDLEPNKKGYSMLYRVLDGKRTLIVRACNGETTGGEQVVCDMSTPKIISMILDQGKIKGNVFGLNQEWQSGTFDATTNQFGVVSLDTPNSLKIASQSGGGSGLFWQGDIFELLIYQRALSPQEQLQVNQHLAERYKQ